MNYKIVEANGKFDVFEKQTNQTIKSFDTRDQAKELMRRLNFGGAFDGFTPQFFLKNIAFSIEKVV